MPTITLTNALVTAYCACKLCCGPLAPRPTASGAWPREGRTVAAPKYVRFGTPVRISSPTAGTYRLIVEDRLSPRHPNTWDIYFRRHKDAVKFGVQRMTITYEMP